MTLHDKIRRSIAIAWLIVPAIVAIACGTGGAGGSSAPGKTGSTARFAITGDVLYTLSIKLDETDDKQVDKSGRISIFSGKPIIRTFDISQPTTPRRASDVQVQSQRPETLFSNGSQVFVGASDGMEIYDLSNPLQPNYLSTLPHVRSCDPVVTEGKTAYVTLRGGRACAGTGEKTNVLEIIDITNMTAPTKLATFSMNSPFGLAVEEGRAFICDGPAGLRILDVKNPLQIKDLPSSQEDICTDVILSSQRLITTGFTGLTQYDVSQLPPRKLSVINLSQDNSVIKK